MTPQVPLRLVVVGGPNGAGKTTLARACAAAHGLRYLLADDWLVGFNGETGYVTVAEGTGAQTVAVMDEGLWAQLVELASAVHEEESP
jgi:predicted kinase